MAQIVDENEFDKLNDPSSIKIISNPIIISINIKFKFLAEIIESITSYIKESLKKDRRYKGISTNEYLQCLAKLAVTKNNKIKVFFFPPNMSI